MFGDDEGYSEDRFASWLVPAGEGTPVLFIRMVK